MPKNFDAMPHRLRPMIAKSIEKPFNDPDWVFEIKWDGYRAIGRIEKGAVNLYSRNLQSFNTVFRPIYRELQTFDNDLILDGEIIALDEEGRSQFQYLQDYRLNRSRPIAYLCFDILYLDGRNLMAESLLDRKDILKRLIKNKKLIKFSDHIEERGEEFFNLTKARGLEGIIAKKKNSPYLPGQRSGYWLKIKAINQEEAIICGFTDPRGGRQYFGSLVLGAFSYGKIEYTGSVGTGFDDLLLKNLYQKLIKIGTLNSPLANPPEFKVHWVKPILVCEVKFTEITREGLYRHPVFLGLREDKMAEEVMR